MARSFIVLTDDAAKAKAIDWINSAKSGTRAEFKGPRRTLPQNDYMWSLLTDVSEQKTHFGLQLTPDQWKQVFIDALKRTLAVVPSLNGEGVIFLDKSSSDLDKEEMADLITLILSYGDEHGVKFKMDHRHEY